MAKSHKAKLNEAARRGAVRSAKSAPSAWEATVDKILVAAEVSCTGMVLTFAHANGTRFTERC